MTIDAIRAALDAAGLVLRGGFHPTAGDDVPEVFPGLATGTLLLIGNVGPRAWQAFQSRRPSGANPLDAWTRAQVDPIAAAAGGRAVFPSERPYLPFQRWAMRSESVHVSPLGLLIHPSYGLWHAYRAALLIGERITVPVPDGRASPCARCAAKPCLAACPVESHRPDGFHASECLAYLASEGGEACQTGGCAARNACPIGGEFRYPEDQVRFHMAAFVRALLPQR